MRRLMDTCVLVCLLVGPAVVLTCVRQPDTPTTEEISKIELTEEEEDPHEVFVYVDNFPRP